MVTLFTLHLMRMIPNPGEYLEFSIEPQGELGEVFDPVLYVEDGAARLPADEPGWGVRVRQQWLDQAEIQSTVCQ